MKIASRFPVKENKGLSNLINSLHILVAIVSFWKFEFTWQFGSALIGLSISYYYSSKQLKEITRASDDLCWTGEQWLITHLNSKNKLLFQETVYLRIIASSWITSRFSLLKFRLELDEDSKTEFVWFFSSESLGDRLYRELCYLCKQDLKEQARSNTDKPY